MKFRNYCIVVMGNMDGAKDDIIKVAETQPRYLDAKGILIATFASVMEPVELEDFFNFSGRSIFIFDLNKSNSGYHLANEKLHNHLFGHLLGDEDKLKEMSEKLMDNISASTSNNIAEATQPQPTKTRKKAKIKKTVNYAELSKKDREQIVNKILDKGFSKLTKSDRETLKNISELE